MKRWVESDAQRLHPQEQALLVLCDRMTVLEQAFTAERDRHLLARTRLDHVQKDLRATQAALSRLQGEHQALLDIREREE